MRTGLGLGAETPLAISEITQCAQEIHTAEVRPQGLAEVELGVGALPGQEAGQSLLAAGADDQVRVRLPLGVQGGLNVIGG